MKRKMNIVITGFMGTGKTTVGREIARRLGMKFYDTDQMVEDHSRMSITEIFERFGEDRFRELERNLMSELLESAEGAVISTGGGTLLDAGIDDLLLKSSIIFCLASRGEILQERIGSALTRPLAGKGQCLGGLLKSRERLYAAMPNQIDTSDLTPGQVADEVIRIYERGAA
jgi:shikimate kinase